MKKIMFLVVLLILINATTIDSQIGYNNPNLPRIEAPPKVITFTNTTGQTNSSIFAEIWIVDEGIKFMDNIADLFATFISAGFNSTINLFDQDLNKSSNVTFESVNATRNLIVGDGASGSHTLDVHGDVEIEHTATFNDDHAVEIDVDAAGFGDVKGISLVYVTGAIVTGQDEEVILVNIDDFLATGGSVAALEVLATEGGANPFGLEVGALVNPVEQLSGVFTDPLICEINGVDQSTACASTGTDLPIFENDNDFVIVGGPAKFEEIEFILDTFSSGAGISPKFEFSTGATTWTEFNPTDGTNAMRNNGIVFFLDSDIPTWATNGSDFLINITRTRNNLVTSPIEDLIRIASTTEYFWNKTGAISVNSLFLEDYDISNICTLSTNQDITGIKNFENLIQLGGAAVYNTTIDDSPMIMAYDSSRDKNLSIETIHVQTGTRLTNSCGTSRYMRYMDLALMDLSGYVAPHNGTITEVEANSRVTQTGTNITFRKNDAVTDIGIVPWDSRDITNTTFDLDVTKGDRIQLRILRAGVCVGTMTSPMIGFNIKWRDN